MIDGDSRASHAEVTEIEEAHDRMRNTKNEEIQCMLVRLVLISDL